MSRFSSPSLVQLLLSATGVLAGLTVDVNDAASIKKAASVVAGDLMSFYTGEIPGLLPGPPPDGDYYQWTGGALWAAMLDYRSRTGDTQYDDKISQGLLWQRGPSNDFLSPNWTASMGNDDQAVWGMTALLAAETGFAEPKGADDPQWLTLARNVFDEQSSPSRRVDSGSCEGGLRWQILPFNNGYNYVNSFANAAYANLGARLSLRDDNNNTQAKSAEDTLNWLQTSKFIDGSFDVFDGAHAQDCDQINKAQFSFPAALALEAAAATYNSTGGEAKWKTLVDGLAQRTVDVFFPSGVAKEIACEPTLCTTDVTFYKSFLHRSLASTVKLAPFTASLILPVLKTSAAAAAASCTGGDNGRLCGLVWTGSPNGETGAGQQMSVLSALLSLLPPETAAEASNSNSTSGSGSGSGTNGINNSSTPTDSSSKPSTTPSSAAQIGASAMILLSSVLLTGLMLS